MKMRAWLAMFGALVLFASAAAHGLIGWPMLRAELSKAAVDRETIGALGVGWIWGSVAMLTFGCIAACAGWSMLRGRRDGVVAARIVGVAYVAFGVITFVLQDMNPHFLVFVGTGAVLVASAWPE
jgi:hypothetical protein